MDPASSCYIKRSAWLLFSVVAGTLCAAWDEGLVGVSLFGENRANGVCPAQTHPSTDSESMFRSRNIAIKYLTREDRHGPGASIRKLVGSGTKADYFDPFLMLDEAYIARPTTFPEHPHRGFETVSYILPDCKGNSTHEDFLGNKGVLYPGDLQWMTAGRGILHAECPGSTEPAHVLQLWLNLPARAKMCEPRYQDIRRDTVPHAFDTERKVEALVFAGEIFGVKGPIETITEVTFIHFFVKKDSKFEYPIPEGHNAFLYLFNGGITVSGTKVDAHHVVVFEQGGDGLEITSSEGAEFLVLSGKPLNEPVAQHGPFVMNTADEIKQAFSDFRSGKNGFENAPGWNPSESWD